MSAVVSALIFIFCSGSRGVNYATVRAGLVWVGAYFQVLGGVEVMY